MSLSVHRVFSRSSRRENLPLAAALLSLLCVALTALSLLTLRSREEALFNSRRQSGTSFFLPTTVRAVGYSPDYCNGASPTNFLRSSNRTWLLLLLPAILFTFIGLALVTNDYLVHAVERICVWLNLSDDVAGVTFMAAVSSAPLFSTSMLSVLITGDDVGIGTVVGSCVFAILIIIGLSAILSRETLRIDFRPLLRDSVFSVLSVVALLVFVLFSTRGQADWWEGLIFLAVYLAYILFMKFGNRHYLNATAEWCQRSMNGSDVTDDAEIKCGMSCLRGWTEEKISQAVAEETIPEHLESPSEHISTPGKMFLGIPLPTSNFGWATLPLLFPWKIVFRATIPNCDSERMRKWWPVTLATTIPWIFAMSYAMIEAARVAGCFMGIPSSVMGLTVLAAGIRVNDALTSVAVARIGLGQFAVINAFSFIIVDILVGLGAPWFIGGLVKRKAHAVSANPAGLVVISIVLLFTSIIVLIAGLALLKWKLSKKLGYAMIAMYTVLLTYTLLDVYVLKIGGG